ncbi:MAG TPA: hypothetical protein VLT47_03260 [Anaeromyxobacteraceae bacterium]|nr:hypothetical protein [Anaeromyxobacteraceae bacterium]
MNRAARRHLLARLDAASRPLFLVSLSPFTEASALRTIRQLGATSYVMPSSYVIEIIQPKGPRVVAGKGGKRRGLRRPAPPFVCVAT